MNDTEFVFVYSTLPDTGSAQKIAEAVVAERLAACANIHSAMTSVYEWDGAMKAESEVALFIKTRSVLAQQVIMTARPLHPYAVPCFLILPVSGGNADYLDWARQQTTAPIS